MKQYQIIYADPPWQYNYRHVQGAAENHYPTMSIKDICNIPVANIAAQDCSLFLWATCPMMNEALATIKAWQFTYKTIAFVWIKTNRKNYTLFWGLGFWTRSNAEFCLLATKGKPQRQSTCIHQVIISPVQKHSQKPEEARERIVALLGDLPRIELFARQYTTGWDCWGNEVDGDEIF